MAMAPITKEIFLPNQSSKHYHRQTDPATLPHKRKPKPIGTESPWNPAHPHYFIPCHIMWHKFFPSHRPGLSHKWFRCLLRCHQNRPKIIVSSTLHLLRPDPIPQAVATAIHPKNEIHTVQIVPRGLHLQVP